MPVLGSVALEPAAADVVPELIGGGVVSEASAGDVLRPLPEPDEEEPALPDPLLPEPELLLPEPPELCEPPPPLDNGSLY